MKIKSLLRIYAYYSYNAYKLNINIVDTKLFINSSYTNIIITMSAIFVI